ncbi:MAG: ABC transporter permease, partial [Clostridiales bacterium]
MVKKNLIKRILQILMVLMGISFLTFCLTYLAPGDPVRTMYAASGVIPSEDVLDQAREELGLNKPFLVQYGTWLFNCFHGDFGTSYSMNKPVLEIMITKLFPTLKLAFVSLLLMIAVSVPFGILAAVKKNKFVDYLVRSTTFLGISVPNFWVGLLLLYFFGLKLGLLPVVSTGNGWEKLILPAVTLSFAMSAKYTRQVRTAVLEELHQDYVMGARARGIAEKTILWRHV